jgi:hypothetical protein
MPTGDVRGIPRQRPGAVTCWCTSRRQRRYRTFGRARKIEAAEAIYRSDLGLDAKLSGPARTPTICGRSTGCTNA